MGGILGFDALCSSSQTVNESQNSSRRGSVVSVQVRVLEHNHGIITSFPECETIMFVHQCLPELVSNFLFPVRTRTSSLLE